MKLVTFNFRVVLNFDNYIGTEFAETHLLKINEPALSWAKKNLQKYFGSDFNLDSIEEI